MKFFKENIFSKWSKVTAVILIMLTVFLGYEINHLQFDYDFEKFFPAEDEDAEFFYEHRKQFEFDNNFILIGLENKKGVFDSEFLLRLDSLTKDLQKGVPYVTTVRSISNQDEVFLYGVNGSSSVPYLNFSSWKENPDSLNNFIQRDSARILRARNW